MVISPDINYSKEKRMRKTAIILSVLTILILLPLKGEKEKKILTVPHKRPLSKVTRTLSTAGERETREQYLRGLKQKREKQRTMTQGCTSGPSGSVTITLDNSYTNYLADSSGNFIMTGVCRNSGITAPVFVQINLQLYDSQGQYIGKADNCVYGGTNVLLAASNTYTNALAMGDTGYFKVWTGYPFSKVSKVSYDFSYQICATTAANAQLSFDGEVLAADDNGNLKLSGKVKNTNTLWAAYCTRVSFAVIGNDGKVSDVNETYIKGSAYPASCGSAESDETYTAVYPGESNPFSLTFNASYSDYSGKYFSGFQWSEAINFSAK